MNRDHASCDEPLLTAQDEVVLARQIEAGVLAGEALHCGSPVPATAAELRDLVRLGEQAHHRFIAANVRMVKMVAGQWSRRCGLPYADLEQEGMVGLLLAVQRYDSGRGVRFSTYALPWIRAQVSTAAGRLLSADHLPPSRAEGLRHARTMEMDLAQRLGRTPTTVELASALGRPPAWIASLLRHERPCSLEDVTQEPVAAADDLERVTSRDRPGAELLGLLDDDARRVIELRLGFIGGVTHSQSSVARTLGWSIGRTRRVEQQALDTLRGACPQSASIHL